MFPGNFSEEHFYWVANAGTTATQGGTGLVLALEGAFEVGPAIAGEQIVFGRVRIRIASVPVSGDYKVYTPFGDFDFPGLTQGERLFFTSDIGIGCGASFDCALNSVIGPFLLPSATSSRPTSWATPRTRPISPSGTGPRRSTAERWRSWRPRATR